MPGLKTRYDPDDLVSYSILDTGPYTDSGVSHTGYWRNTFGTKVKVVGVQLGTWADYGTRADTFVGVWRDADETLLHQLGWDHYAEPDSPWQSQMRWFAPYGYYLYPGDLLRLQWWFTGFSGPTHVTHNCTLWLPAGG